MALSPVAALYTTQDPQSSNKQKVVHLLLTQGYKYSPACCQQDMVVVCLADGGGDGWQATQV